MSVLMPLTKADIESIAIGRNRRKNGWKLQFIPCIAALVFLCSFIPGPWGKVISMVTVVLLLVSILNGICNEDKTVKKFVKEWENRYGKFDDKECN